MVDSSRIEDFVRSNIRSLCPYSTARDEYEGALGIFLDANESPYPTRFNRYPDPRQRVLKEKLSAVKGVPAERIFVGNGSDEAIDLLLRVFCTPGVDNVVAISPSYGMYQVAAATNDVEFRNFALSEDFSLDVDGLLGCCDHRTKLIFLCSPNNPSGNAFDRELLLDVARRFDGMLAVDEAYIDFSSQRSLSDSIDECSNIIVLQTLSKAWGMAGLRLGLAFADEYVVRLMSMVKYPYNINSLAQETVVKALDNPIDAQVREIVQQRVIVADALAAMPFVCKVYPSDANFLLVKVDDADRLYAHLLECGIIVRNRSRVSGCANCLRITIGLPQENARLVEALREYELLRASL